MKKLFSAVLAIAMILSVAPVAMAADSLNVYLKDDEYYDDLVTSVAPGSSCWVYLVQYDKDTTKGPKSISFDDIEVVDSDTGKTVKMLSVDRTATKLKGPGGDRAWFAKITVKSVSTSSYPEDGYDVENCTLEYTYDDHEYTGDVNLSTIEYEEADDELEEDEKMFTYKKDDDVDIDLPDNGGTFTGTARKDFDIIASMNTNVNNTLLNKYPNADMQFYNGNGATFPVTSGRLTIRGDKDDYIYEVGANNSLTDRSSTWSSSKDAFVISTTKIGKYIVSDTKLSASSSSNTDSPSPSSSSSQSEYIGSVPIANNGGITNPSTGACV